MSMPAAVVHAPGMDNCTLRDGGRTLSMPRALDNVDNIVVQPVESLSYGCVMKLISADFETRIMVWPRPDKA